MLVWIAVATAASVDPSELVEAEVAAAALIEDCEHRGIACDVSRESLGEAYLVRAIASVLLRGEVDPVASANAHLLVPHRTDAWTGLLGGAMEPDPFLYAWTREPERGLRERVAVGEHVDEPEPEEHRPPAKRRPLDAEPPRLGGPTILGLQIEQPLEAKGLGGELEARASFRGALTGLGRFRYERARSPITLPPPFIDTVDRTVILEESSGELEVGVGLRRSSDTGETLAYVGGQLFSHAPTFRSFAELQEELQVIVDPGHVGGHAMIGFLGRGGFRGLPLSVQLDCRLLLGVETKLGQWLDERRRLLDSWRPQADTSARLVNELDVLLDVPRTRLRVALGGTADARPLVTEGKALYLRPHLGVSYRLGSRSGEG